MRSSTEQGRTRTCLLWWEGGESAFGMQTQEDQYTIQCSAIYTQIPQCHLSFLSSRHSGYLEKKKTTGIHSEHQPDKLTQSLGAGQQATGSKQSFVEKNLRNCRPWETVLIA